MRVAEFDFDLPPDLIAQAPATDRDAARLLHLDRAADTLRHAHVRDLPRLLLAGDLLVMNDSRVFPARLLGHRVPSGGAVECLLVGRAAPVDGAAAADDDRAVQWWDALVHPGQKLKPGARLAFGGGRLLGEIVGRGSFGRRLVRLWTEDHTAVDAIVDDIGHIPLPPYIKRSDADSDRERYQTVYAENRGSVAAPTAGLHFSRPLLDALRAAGVQMTTITLHVGYGTFQPVRVEEVEAHRLEPETYVIGEAAAAAIGRARAEGRRVIAVGTTTTRTLEAVALRHGGEVVAEHGRTDLFIHPGHPGFAFQAVDGLLTNFHVPRSSLLMLVSAFAGVERIRAAYRAAVDARYRFYSYGDAMFIS